MRAVDQPLAVRDLVNFIHKNRALALQLLYYIAIVDDLLAHIDRRPKGIQRDPHNVNGPHNSGAKPPGLQQQQSLSFWCHLYSVDYTLLDTFSLF